METIGIIIYEHYIWGRERWREGGEGKNFFCFCNEELKEFSQKRLGGKKIETFTFYFI